MKPVVIFAATRWELRAIHRVFPTAEIASIDGFRCVIGQAAGRTYWLVRTGVGPDEARRAASTVMGRYAVESAISSGFACALAPAEVGDLILGSEVASACPSGGWTLQEDVVVCDERMRERALAASRGAGLRVMVGKIISVPSVVGSAGDKERLSRISAAVGLDMESAAIGAVAAEKGVPFAIARAVSDLGDEDLPIDFNLFLRPGGWLKGLRSLLTQPAALTGMNRLRKQSRVAADRLTRLFAAYVNVSFPRGGVTTL